MRNFILFQLLTILVLGYSCSKKENTTVVKGTVHRWPTDTVYLTTLPYYSPYSSDVKYQIISNDSTFSFEINDQNAPFIVFIAPEKSTVNKNMDELLFDNLTENYYFSHCPKFYANSSTTYLIEPSNELTLELTFNCWYDQLTPERADFFRKLGANIGADNRAREVGETKISFNSLNISDYEYYQRTFNIDQEIDDYVRPTDNLEFAVNEYIEIEKIMLSDLSEQKDVISPFLFEHLKSQIQFAARKEFIKSLSSETDTSCLENLFLNDIPDYITNFIEFDKENINYPTLISEEYNEYLELYLNFKLSIREGKYIAYKKFDKDKFNFAKSELPEISRYFYLANNLLHTDDNTENKKLTDILIKDYPNGVLNNKLTRKFQ